MGGQNSVYRLNINGASTYTQQNTRLEPGDSLYIFAEVTIDQRKVSNPFIVKDSIRFYTNGNEQFVNLKTYGRKAIIHREDRISASTTWRSDTPHLIVDYAIVDSNTTLTIEKGTDVYVAGSGNFYIFGRLRVNGTKEERVRFQGTRPEAAFKNSPGQWHGIRILPSSQNNIINNTILTEGTVGIEVDSLALPQQGPKLTLLNSRISNMSRTGIAGFSADILLLNTIISECCGNLFTGRFGGTYQFYHCTLMASSCFCSPQGAGLILTDEAFPGKTFELNVTLFNSIVWGNQEDEINIVNQQSEQPNIALLNNLLKTSMEVFKGNGNVLNQAPQLQNRCNYNFKPRADAPILDAGAGLGRLIENNPQLPIDEDYYNNTRDTAAPDIGAIERQ